MFSPKNINDENRGMDLQPLGWREKGEGGNGGKK